MRTRRCSQNKIFSHLDGILHTATASVPPTCNSQQNRTVGDKSLEMDELKIIDYQLPRELIAQQPLPVRSSARLLVIDREREEIRHASIMDLPELLRAGDLLVANDSRVLPARLMGRRVSTGGRWEGLFLSVEDSTGLWCLLAHSRGRLEIGERVVLIDRSGVDAYEIELIAKKDGGIWQARAITTLPATEVLVQVGRVPLPGYIRRGIADAADHDRYQTIFAQHDGSAAAPTAGLHFTPELIDSLLIRGITTARVTLHVGVDTFRPISVERIEDHPMHCEWGDCPEKTAMAVRHCRSSGGRVVAIGTTAVRVLETAAISGEIEPWKGTTRLFIRPGFQFRSVDCLLTNFHLPRTTLLLLVSALAGSDLLKRAYQEAIMKEYRFLSYGDAMLVL